MSYPSYLSYFLFLLILFYPGTKNGIPGGLIIIAARNPAGVHLFYRFSYSFVKIWNPA